MSRKIRLPLTLTFAMILAALALLQFTPPSASQSAAPVNAPISQATPPRHTDAEQRQSGNVPPAPRPEALSVTNCGAVNASSNIRLPSGRECSDTRFYVDSGAGLDTGCTFRSGGPLVIDVKIARYFGNKQKLIANGLLGSPGGSASGLSGRVATLRLPAFDVDFSGSGGQGVEPERDRVSLNGHQLLDSLGQTAYLQGADNVWHLNEIRVPIEYVNFPNQPGEVADNLVQIDIDTFNPSVEAWCTAIDWATIEVEAARPALLIHGILSGSYTWAPVWTQRLDDLGIPHREMDLNCLPQTIGTNAGLIGAKVTELKDLWKVDKINLIGHSKGGLDARDYAEGSDSVSQLIQIGTPNTGTRLADALIGGSTLLGFAVDPEIALHLNFLLADNAPGGYQLTKTYMLGYNLIHDHNENVRYTALAGFYTPDCTLCLNNLLKGVVGEGDLIVPISSVHGMPFTTNRTLSTTGGSCELLGGGGGFCAPSAPNTNSACDAMHTKQTSSNAIFDLLKPTMTRFDDDAGAAQEAGSRRSDKEAVETGPAPSMSRVGVLQLGQMQSQTMKVDQISNVFFTLLYPSGRLDLALISPSGQRFDRNTTNPNVQVRDEEMPGGRIATFGFSNLEAGIWTAEISAPVVAEASGRVPYSLTCWVSSSPITFSGSFQSSNVPVGNPLRLLGTLRNSGAPILNATVNGLVQLPNRTTQQVALKDDGTGGDATANDGIYTATFTNTGLPGTYRVLFQADRGAGSGLPAFSRELLNAGTVSNSNSTLSSFSSAGVDTNGNSLFDKLSVQVTLNITQNGTYRVVGRLADTAGNIHFAKTVSALNTGTQTMTLDFDGQRIYRNRVNGPYRLASVTLVEESGGESRLLDTRTDAHMTTALQFRAFEHDPLVFTGNGSAVGVDTNSNGLFDLLRTTLEIDVAQAGFYNWTAQLLDRNGRDLGFATGSGNLVLGNNNLIFNFDGSRIGLNNVDGPYLVTGLLVYGSNFSLIQQEVLNTPAFRSTQFEGRTCMGAISPGNQTYGTSGGTGQVAVSISQDCAWNAQVTPIPTGTSSFSNSQGITIRDGNTAGTYPSLINVSGLSGSVSKVTVTLSGLSHTYPDDVDVMLIAPTGQATVLMSDAGGGTDISNLSLTFDQAAANSLADENVLATGTFRPVNYELPDNFPAPGPGTGNFTADLGVFNGLNPNGAWQLLIVDDVSSDSGVIANGWSLNITTATAPTWLSVTSGSNGTGNGTVSYSVVSNATGVARSATLTVAGQTFTVTQAGGTTPTVQFAFASFNANEAAGFARVTVTRTGDASGTAVLNYKTQDDFAFRPCEAAGSSANQRCDYAVANGQLTFNPGESSKTFDVLINDDFYVESAETVNILISNVTGAALGPQSTATVTIQDNDIAVPTAQLYVAYLSGSQETPANNSLATGAGTLLLNAGETSAQVSLSFANLGSAQTAALIQGFAPATQTASPLFGLSTGTVTNQTINLSATQVQQLKAGNLYFNVSTVNFGSGEIRGQILANPIDNAQFFVRSHYYDFLARRPDSGGLNYWTGQIAEVCGSDATCTNTRRNGVSAAYFIEQEFQESGAYVYRLYKAAFGQQVAYRPSYSQFMPDRARVVGGTSLNQGKLDFAQLFVGRSDFTSRYGAGLSASQFVAAILTTVQQGTGVTFSPARQDAFIADVTNGGRGLMMKNLAEDSAFKAAVFNRAFVLTQYFGYLRRDPDQGGYDFWVNVLNSQPNNFTGMVCAFITSTEYQQRFSPIALRSNAGC
jgi:subtilisin-like proprotein convertase family protein/pimeloyl-ACP methyl ester carboxylesterase